MKKFVYAKVLILFLLMIPRFGNSQMKMDIELLGGIIFNGNKYNYSDENYTFKLKNGLSSGLGFDVWFSKDYSVSFGYRSSKSTTRSSLVYPDGFRLKEESFPNGILKDRIFYLGIKKKIVLGETISIQPFVGLYYNLFVFENEERKFNSTIEQGDYVYVESRNIYARFNNVSSKIYGAIGTSFGLSFEKSITNIGTFSLNLAYSVDVLRNVQRVLHAEAYNAAYHDDIGWVESYYGNNDSQRLGRNLLQLEAGFKMPCSILFGKKD